MKPIDYTLYAGFVHLGAGLACGFTGLAAGWAIGYVGDSVSASAFLPGKRPDIITVCTRVCIRDKSFRIDGLDPHLWRGTGVVRVRHQVS